MDILKSLTKEKISLKHSIGIYISQEAISIAETKQQGKGLKVEKFLKVPLPQVKKTKENTTRMAAMNADFFDNEVNWFEPLQKAFSSGQWGTNKVIITLAPQFAVVRHFMMPFVEPRFRKKSIPIESKKYVPFQFEDSFYDFHVYSADPAQPRGKIGVMFALTSKKISEALIKATTKLQLELISIEVSAVSIERIFAMFEQPGQTPGRVHAHFESSVAYMVLSNRSVPVLFREVNFSESQATERRRLDMRSSIDFAQKQIGQEIFKDVSLSGENLDLWKMVSQEDSKLPVNIWEPNKLIGVQENDWGSFAAVGASAKYMADDPVDVDLMGKPAGADNEKVAMITVWGAMILLLAFLAVLAGIQQANLYMIKKEYDKIKSRTVVIPEFEGLSKDEITAKIEGLKAKASILQAVLGEEDFATPKMEAIVNSIPEKVWLQSFDYKNVIRTNMLQPKINELSMKGSVRSGDSNIDINLANSFKDKLAAQQEIVDTYGSEVNISIESGRKKDFLRPTDTTFMMNCVQKAAN